MMVKHFPVLNSVVKQNWKKEEKEKKLSEASGCLGVCVCSEAYCEVCCEVQVRVRESAKNCVATFLTVDFVGDLTFGISCS